MFPHHLGCKCSTWVVFPLYLVLLPQEEEEEKEEEAVQNWLRTFFFFFKGAQRDRNFMSATVRGFSATAAASDF